MTWLLQRTLDLIELLAAWLYERKYGAIARRIGRAPARHDGRAGLIILQIDGLSHQTLLAALDRGAMPYLKRLIERDGHRLQGWWCGVPSSTPAIQGGLMYGNNENVPAFRWYEKQTGQTFVAKHPQDAHLMQERLSEGRSGLLTGGSSYVNLLDGGARLALFTVSALNPQRLFENVRGVGFAMLLLLSPLRLLRIIGNAIWDYGRDLGRRLVTRFDTALGRRRRRFSPIASLFQIIASVIFRELQTFGILTDIYRRIPAIYANFYGYDEVAHQLGVLDDETARVLKGIDHQVKEIDTARKRFSFRRKYDLFIFSDHGMSPSTPFKELYGESLGELLARLVAQHSKRPISLDERGDGQPHANTEARFLLNELEGIQANLSPRSQKLAGLLRDFVARRVPAEDAATSEWDLSRQCDLILRNSGTVSHVYFTLTRHQMDMSEIELIYPGLLRQLVEHPGPGLILGRERGQAMVMTINGLRQLNPAGRPADPLVLDLLDNLPDPLLAAAQLARLTCFSNSGDLVIFGRWDSRGQVVCFEPHWATHGGVGGEQNRPFMLLPPHLDWDISRVTGPEQLYPLFMGRYGLQKPPPADQPDPADQGR